MRYVAPILTVICLSGLVQLPTSGQVVRGQATEQGTGDPLAGAFIVLLDTANVRIGAALADQDGNFLLLAPGPGRYSLRMERRLLGTATVLVFTGILAIVHILVPPVPRIHETKALPMTLSFPDARIEARTEGPLGMIHVVGSSLIRYAAGLSLNFGLGDRETEARLPEQKALFLDADALSPVTRFSGDLNDLYLAEVS